MSEEVDWKEATTPLQWAEEMLKQGNWEIVKLMVQVMPESNKAAYRALWKKYKQEKK